jgi:hypothetical protein
VLGALTIWGDYSKYNDLGFISGLLVLTIPIFDMVYVMILRILHGRSPFFGSPDHFALRLQKKYRLSAAKTVSLIIMIQLALSALVIVNFYSTRSVTILTTIAIVLFFSIFGVILARVKME